MVQFIVLILLPFFGPPLVAWVYFGRANARYERFLNRVSDYRAPTGDDLAGQLPWNIVRTVVSFVRLSDRMEDAVRAGTYGLEGQRLLAEVVSRRRLAFLSLAAAFLVTGVVLPALVPHSWYVIGRP